MFFGRFVLTLLVTAVILHSATHDISAQPVPERLEPGIQAQVTPDSPEPEPAMTSPRIVGEQPMVVRVERDFQQPGREQYRSRTEVDRTTASLAGTVINTNGEVVPGAIVVLDGPRAEDRQTTIASESGAFQFINLEPGVSYRVSVEHRYFEPWTSDPVTLAPGQFFYLKGVQLKIPALVTSVSVYETREQIAAQQVTLELNQRVLGFIPNFWVTYDDHPEPLTTKLKFKLALKSDTDVMTFIGVAFMAGIYQAGDVPDYGQGAKGFFKRMGAGYADTTSNIFLGGAIYPWLFRQDPRYYYQGTGTVKSRLVHALSSPYICKGDNGKKQPNYSSLGGDLTSGAISNFYYPESDRGAGLLFEGFAVTTAVRTVNAVIQEFLLRKLTPSARAKSRP